MILFPCLRSNCKLMTRLLKDLGGGEYLRAYSTFWVGRNLNLYGTYSCREIPKQPHIKTTYPMGALISIGHITESFTVATYCSHVETHVAA